METDVKEMVDAMVATGIVKAGYQYIFIDDGCQGGRDNKNNMIQIRKISFLDKSIGRLCTQKKDEIRNLF